ncbi:hypothetical protein [Hominenteromicrobium sp.]|jgi:hypothetical protein|uniref:hypothetical protein n=1 Tax=Hominenteromicrobium sp. TaxID=3073581 RepID=UPI003AF13216
MRKTVLILWGVGALFLISSIPLFVEGDIGAGVCGIVIAAVLFFIGLRKKAARPEPKKEPPAATPAATEPKEAAAPAPKADTTAHVTPAADPRPAKAEAAAPAPASEAKPAFEFLSVKVAGVTFKNGRKSRQTILRKIHFKDEPFNKGTMELTLQREEWEGKPAFGVYVNGDQIGNIPAEYVSYVNDNFSRLDGIVNMEVYGGGEGRNYGAEITLRFRNE